MTKKEQEFRDRCAALAMQALLSNPFASREIARDAEESNHSFADVIAANAFDLGEAMMHKRRAQMTLENKSCRRGRRSR